MATLEKIRSKSVLLLIIIAVALLAFILGDFFTSGRTFFGAGTTIAKVDGQKIDVQEFQRRLEEANQQAQQSGSKVDGSVLQQQVLDQMIAEMLVNKEIEDLGLVVTSEELTNLMFGAAAGGYFDNMVRQQFGVESAQVLHDMAYNPTKYGLDNEQAAALRNAWVELEQNAEKQLLQQKFQNLFMGTLVANDLDAKALYDENAATSKVAFAKKDYATMDDAKYEVSDADLKNEWESRKNRYRLNEETRLVDYIAVEIVPSADDVVAGSQKVEKALEGLRTQDGTMGLEGMTEFVVERKNLTAATMKNNKAMKAFVDSMSVGQAGIVSHSGNDYVLAKILGTSAQVDSVNIDYLAIPEGTRAQIDSLISKLNAGETFANAAANSLVSQSQDSTWLSLVDPQLLTLKEVLTSTPTGVWFTPDTLGQGGRIFRVRTRKAPVAVYDVATINYVVEPSNATINTLQADLSRFIKENATAQLFAEKAAEAGYNARTANVTPSSAQIGNLNDSHAAVAWAMDAKKGEVSGVFGDETSGRFLAVALEDIYDKGFTPANDPTVKEELTKRVRNSRKGDDLLKQYEGKAKDIAGYAQLMQASVDTTDVAFGQMFIPRVGVNESEFVARVAAAKQGQLVGPFKGNNAVYVVSVTAVDAEGRPFNAEESATQFTQQRAAGALGRNIVNILRGNKKIENKSLNFYK
ncbi:MAG: SurA N-terminal domain-containing protein [Muribaculaceae bacterium]|nr:SurA N-terminal domain-containing protein [Muribaculaceae bacterium]